MLYVIIDTETTGLYSKDEVIQFAAIICDEKYVIHRIVNFYCDTAHPINEKAQAVHGIDFEKLHKLSEGLTFEDQFLPFLKSLEGEDVVWIEWSTNGFDMRMINQTLAKYKLQKTDFGKGINTLGEIPGIHHYNLLHGICNVFYGGHSRQLGIACSELLKHSTEQIDELYEKYIKMFDIRTGKHNADYDAFLCYLLLISYGNRL